MKPDTENQIIVVLQGAVKKAETLKSIEEKREFYRHFLVSAIACDVFVEAIDPKSPEVDQIISDNFLNIKPIKPVIFEDDGYAPWLEDAKGDISWNFYDRYEKYLLFSKHWKPSSVNAIKVTSDIILDHLSNPKTENYFNRIGLVMGDIQSGKTANYTAVINKAIDAGYKIIIVLAGMTRDLRNQTQRRLDSEVLGYETKTNGKGKTIGVGTKKPLHIEGLTYSDDIKDYGDMKKYFSSHTLDEKLNPIVAIVKKNTSVLQHLHKFLTSSPDHCYTNGKLNVPVLIIDDEVDQASVNTKQTEDLENASAINKKIRTILNSLNRYAYIGYTATPFANVFIDPDANDIYPKDFILAIPPGDDYCGIKEYFGVDIVVDNEDNSDNVKDLFVNIKDYKSLFGSATKIDAATTTYALNESLKDAIDSFILASSIKKSRGIIGYNSMLIHIARFKNPATSLKPLVSDYLTELYHGLKYDSKKAEKTFYDIWISRFKNVSEKRLGAAFKDSWIEIRKHLLDTVESSLNNLKVLNGDSGDILDYSVSKTGDYIVIGGDKLSRGLTLEGLVVSYYYRNSKMYDSLLQMGRWFGYRKGWIDVCRVYTTIRFMNDFITVGKVLQKFKSDIDEMYRQHLNPRQVGQRIMYSPNLIPTARNKMKKTALIKVSFSGELQQVITFNRKHIHPNYMLTENFIKNLGQGEIRKNHKVVFKDVPVALIIEYLKAYKEDTTYYGFGQISIVNWINYIQNLASKGELTHWTVVLSSLTNDISHPKTIAGYQIYKPGRNLRDAIQNDGDSASFERYTIKANTNPADFREIFDPESKEYKEIDHYDPTKDYPGFDATHGLMAIYVFDLFEKKLTGEYDIKTNKEKTVRGQLVSDGVDVCAPAIWFPKTKDYESSAIIYYVNKDYLEMEQKQEQEDENEFGGEEDA